MKDLKISFVLLVLSLLTVPIRRLINDGDFKMIKGIGGEEASVSIITPDCIKLFSSIEKHAKNYGIPVRYALGIAHVETSYNGPFHWKYNPRRTSCVGALGPMQIMPNTANLMWKTKIPKSKLISDIDFNVETSMKLLQRLYLKYHDWKIVFGYYNTGRPCVNSYSIKVFNFNAKK